MKRTLNLIMTLALTLTTWSLRAGVNPHVVEVDIDAHWPGVISAFGPAIADPDEADPMNLFLAVNDDDDNGDGVVDNEGTSESSIDAEDDEIAALIVRQFAPSGLTGTLTMEIPSGLRIFSAAGVPVSTPVTVDLSAPTGPLAGILTGDVTFFIEATATSSDAAVVLRFTPAVGASITDAVHMTLTSTDVTGSFTRGSVQYATATKHAGRWYAGGTLDSNHPLSVLVPVPPGLFGVTTAQLEYRLESGPARMAVRLNEAYFQEIADFWNVIINALGILFPWWALPEYEAIDIANELSTKLEISSDELMDGRYFCIKNLDTPGLYQLTYSKGSTTPFSKERLIVVKVDLDIDSDNNNGLDASWTRTDYEDQIEDAKQGKYVCENRGDKDGDGVPNFADGFDKWGNSGANAGGSFTPLILELAEPLDLSALKVKFTYTASDPAGVTRTGEGTPADPYIYAPATGNLRVWKVDGSADRSKAEVSTVGGHYVKPGSEYSAANLGAGRVITLYVEGISKSSTLGDQQIKVEIDPDGIGPAGYQCTDAVRTTIIKVDLVPDAGKVHHGFDPPNPGEGDSEDEPYWASVVQGGENTIVNLEIAPEAIAGQIECRIVSGGEAYVDIEPKTYSAATTALTITGKTGLGANIYEPMIQFVLNPSGEVLKTLKVMVFTEWSIEAGLYSLEDAASAGTDMAGIINWNDCLVVCNDVFKQTGVRFSLHSSSGSRTYPYDTRGLKDLLPAYPDMCFGFDETLPLRTPDGAMTRKEWHALTHTVDDGTGNVYTPPALSLFECASLDDTVSIVVANAGATPYSGTGPPYIRGFAGFPGPGVVYAKNLVSTEHLKLVIAHEIGHRLALSTADEDGRHDIPPYSAGVVDDIPNGDAGVKPGPAHGGTLHLDEPEKAIMGSGSPLGGKLPWLHGRWMRHEDWKAANEAAEALVNE